MKKKPVTSALTEVGKVPQSWFEAPLPGFPHND